jgi:lipid-A-disaccharide synthase
MQKSVMIVTGEASSEMFGSLLSQQLKALAPEVYLYGMGGVRMEREGVQIITPIVSSHGLVEVFMLLSKLKKSFDTLVWTMRRNRPDVLVLIDYPDFNIPLAKKAKALGIPIVYYVSPTVWAWRKGRAKKIAHRVNAIALIFPFEVSIYKPLGVPCEFVGHPVLDYHEQLFPPGSLNHHEARLRLGLDPHRPTLAIMPGSRSGEIRQHMPILKQAIKVLQSKHPELQFVIPQAPGVDLKTSSNGITLVNERVGEVLLASDGAVIASGTAALEACFFHTPMVMIYKTPSLNYFLAKKIIKVKTISHVNMILDKTIVPELIQEKFTVTSVVCHVEKILWDTEYCSSMINAFKEVSKIFGPSGASYKTAKIVAKAAGWNL